MLGRRRRVGHVPDRPRDAATTTPPCSPRSTTWPPSTGSTRAAELLPEVLLAGQAAGALTDAGAPRCSTRPGTLQPGVPLCPPEGDAGTGMVATNSVAPRTGNVSAGTSIFAMVVLEQPLTRCTTSSTSSPPRPATWWRWCTATTARASSRAWAGLFGRVRRGARRPTSTPTTSSRRCSARRSTATPDGGGLLAYNYLSGEPITGLAEGRPLVVRTPDSRLTLANFMRAQLYGAFGTLRPRHATS